MWDASSNDKPKRNPFCSRCRNHGKRAEVKGHKRHCEYRFCMCEGCKLVQCRQLVSAAQIKRRRYQKQDEECGRRIEVSPPVLSRAPTTDDPAALIAETLIGPAAKQAGSSKQLEPVSLGPLALGPAGRLPTRIQNQLQNQMMALPGFSAGPSLHDALLFQFTAAFSQQHANPSNLLIAGASGCGGGGGGGGLAGLGGGGGGFGGAHSGDSPTDADGCPPSYSSLALSSALFPGPREQFNMVEEIHQSYGPLATYAWLLAEGFSVSKVRGQIERAKAAYDELLQMNGHSALDLTSPIVDI